MARRILVAVAALAVLGGCSSAPAAGPASSAVAETPTTAVRMPATLPDAVDPAPPEDPYCAALAGADALDAIQQLGDRDAAAAATAVDVADAAIDQLAAVAPEEVRGDWATLAAAYGALFDAYRDAGYDFTALMADPHSAAVLEQLGGTDLLDAGDRVEQHAEAACGVSVGLGRTADDGDVPTPEATDTTTSAGVSDDDAAGVGALLLEEFGIEATRDQQICFGRAVSDPETVARYGGDGSDPLELYRALAGGCGIDTSAIP